MLFEAKCAGCGSRGPSPCAGCVDRLVPLTEVAVPGVERCCALLAYDDLSRRFITQFKYRGVRTAVPWLSAAMASQVEDLGERIDAVTWVPAGVQNRRRRGFDQAEALARPIARRLGIPVRRYLRRCGRRGQTGSAQATRLQGPGLSLVGSPRGQRVLIIDDVLTSGGSMAAAARVLRAGGTMPPVGAVAAHRRFV